MEERKSEEFLVEKTLLHICSTDEDESKIIIPDESSTKEIESECVHKNVNKEEYAKNGAEHEEPTGMDDPVVKEQSYLKIFE